MAKERSWNIIAEIRRWKIRRGDNDEEKSRHTTIIMAMAKNGNRVDLFARAAPDNANKMFTPLFASSSYSPFVFLSQFGVFALALSRVSLFCLHSGFLLIILCYFILISFQQFHFPYLVFSLSLGSI